MATIVSSIGLKGLEGYRVHVEVQLMPGVEGVSIVGLPNASVKESKDRVMSALYANDCQIPDKKVIINLSPAEQQKNSPIFDLAMAIGAMYEAGVIQDKIPKGAAFLGVLSLDGSIKPVGGMLPAVLAAKNEGFSILYLPWMEDFPLSRLGGMELRFVRTLREVIESFSGQLSVFNPSIISSNIAEEPTSSDYKRDFKHILGHEKAKRALEIAAAGGHNVLMSGPPGCGKSLLAETFSSILPKLTEDARYEVMSIYQLSGLPNKAFHIAPFRNPHHSSSAVSLIGGGSNPKPGEVSLAHRGVLFLDEMAEFPKRTLDMLRQPIETGKVTISRASSTVTYPAQFLLLGAMNPCPCGYLGSRHFYCTCSPNQITAYANRVSGPIQDRMDILLYLQAVALNKETMEGNEESEVIRGRVTKARERQYARYGAEILNANVSQEWILEHVKLSSDQQKMVQQWSTQYNWSTRVQMKVLRIARTIADLQDVHAISNESLWEAMTLRRTVKSKEQKTPLAR
ncbi:YifB family Mg chelatase-like AAA ATPase [Aquibacillus koreensis]|uniref:YifB family Mg chelatase-like AAA ATPase n=1 Tax=Aquibacillus koreensis TaxID=279446 RepID=A0A9X4AHM3_9BACI|nr:YifB family Mg chelatase-like AAA ATPase [Aquibacillus koreensis]MCT2537158.1 YifB family Mg chelatase-like AAA ATPase [Aquibacillus koreensis]MDC3419859.1 YifB family Mg chelatase-like AAA ATPase [Aquibacillus koreensis]